MKWIVFDDFDSMKHRVRRRKAIIAWLEDRSISTYAGKHAVLNLQNN